MTDGAEKRYPIPANYASKSKLVQGDRLKLIILESGTFIFKQIELVLRKLLTGKLIFEANIIENPECIIYS